MIGEGRERSRLFDWDFIGVLLGKYWEIYLKSVSSCHYTNNPLFLDAIDKGDDSAGERQQSHCIDKKQKSRKQHQDDPTDK